MFNSQTGPDRIATHLEFLQLLQDHVVRHIVKQPVGSREDNVTKLDIKGRAICCVGAAGTEDPT